MLDLALTSVAACLVWWGSTGAILSLIGRSEATYRWSMLATTVSAVGALAVVVATRGTATAESAIAAFVATIVLWGMVEMAFLMGYIVGPRKDAPPPGASVGLRFKAAWGALAYHEIALAAALLLLLLLVQGEANTLAFRMYALLWLMRLSTKINIFLGVSNASEDLLPSRIAYLRHHFRKAAMNPLFPWSVTAATVITLVLAQEALRPDASAFEAISATLLATFAALAVIEHWLLVLPLPSTALWPWARRHETAPQTPSTKLVPAIAGDGRC